MVSGFLFCIDSLRIMACGCIHVAAKDMKSFFYWCISYGSNVLFIIFQEFADTISLPGAGHILRTYNFPVLSCVSSCRLIGGKMPEN